MKAHTSKRNTVTARKRRKRWLWEDVPLYGKAAKSLAKEFKKLSLGRSKHVVALLLATTTFCLGADTHLFKALHIVESSGRTGHVVGDKGLALGPYQIHYAYWLDVRDVVGGSYMQVTNKAYAEQVVTAYLNRYVPKAVQRRDYEVMARVHKGGPRGYRDKTALPYWARVKKVLKSHGVIH